MSEPNDSVCPKLYEIEVSIFKSPGFVLISDILDEPLVIISVIDVILVESLIF